MSPLLEVFLLALKLGLTAFGGPAAHIAMLRDEVVSRRKWMTDDEFLDLLGATNLIPGPNSTKMVIHIGRIRAGLPGLILAGTAFIIPAMLTVLVLACAFVQLGATPQAGWAGPPTRNWWTPLRSGNSLRVRFSQQRHLWVIYKED